MKRGDEKIAGVVLDDWKAAIFRKHLNAEGYSYTEHSGVVKGTMLFKVKTRSIPALGAVILNASNECNNSPERPVGS